jgi:hypothetical protein
LGINWLVVERGRRVRSGAGENGTGNSGVESDTLGTIGPLALPRNGKYDTPGEACAKEKGCELNEGNFDYG